MALPTDTTDPLRRMTMDGLMISHARIPPPPPPIRPMDIRCQCSAVRFRTPTPKPLAVYHCHCRECRRQSSTAYGTSAVYPVAGLFPLDPLLRSKLSVYIRPGERSRTGRDMACFFCTACGARVMHRYLKRRRTQAQAQAGVETTTTTKPSAGDGTGCGGGGDLGGWSEDEPDTTATDNDDDATDDASAAASAAAADAPPDLDDEASYDGTTITIKGGLIAGLDYAQAVHIYTEQAVVPIPHGVKQYPGTPPESP